jgi:hypothetical protein
LSFRLFLRLAPSQSIATDPTFSAFSLSDVNEYGDNVYHFLKGRKGGFHLVHDNYIYRSNFRRQGVSRNIYYWECINNRKGRCRGRLKTIGDKLYVANSNGKRWRRFSPRA